MIHQVDAYCSKDCQVWAWKAGHKEECVAGKGAQLRAETDAQIQVEIDNMKLKADGTSPAFLSSRMLTPNIDDVQLQIQITHAIEAMFQTCGGDVFSTGAHSVVDCIAKFESALAAARKAGHKYAQWTCNHYLEGLYTTNGQTDASIVSLEECLRLSDDSADKAYAYKGLGNRRLEAMDYQSALGFFEQAKCIAEGADMDRKYACLSEIGICLRMLGDCERAVELHSQELVACRSNLGKRFPTRLKEIAAPGTDKYVLQEESCALMMLGLSLAALAKKKACAGLESTTAESAQLFQEARKMLEETVKRAQLAGYVNMRLHAMMAQSCVTFELGEVDEAVGLLWRFLEYHSLGLGRKRCVCCGLLADKMKDSIKKSLVCGGCGVVRSAHAVLETESVVPSGTLSATLALKEPILLSSFSSVGFATRSTRSWPPRKVGPIANVASAFAIRYIRCPHEFAHTHTHARTHTHTHSLSLLMSKGGGKAMNSVTFRPTVPLLVLLLFLLLQIPSYFFCHV